MNSEIRNLLLCLVLPFALRVWAQPAASSQSQIRVHFERAQKALQTSDFSTAEREFQAILALDPGNLDARANAGTMKFFLHDWSGAAEQFRAALAGRPPVPKIQALLGLCERRLGRPAEARRLLWEALPGMPEGALQAQAGLELVEILYQTRDLEPAADVLRILRRAQTVSPDVLYATARVYADLANESRDVLVSAAPASGQMHVLMAQALVNRGDAPGAIAQYRKALGIAPALRGVHFELGEAILADSRADASLLAAAEEFRLALIENPGDSNAEYRIGLVSSLRGDFQAAIQHYQKAIQLQPEHPYAHLKLGAAWMKTGEPQKAVVELLIAARLTPAEPSVHYRLAGIYRASGRTEEAASEIAIYKKLREKEKLTQDIYTDMHQARKENLIDDDQK